MLGLIVALAGLAGQAASVWLDLASQALPARSRHLEVTVVRHRFRNYFVQYLMPERIVPWPRAYAPRRGAFRG